MTNLAILWVLCAAVHTVLLCLYLKNPAFRKRLGQMGIKVKNLNMYTYVMISASLSLVTGPFGLCYHLWRTR